MRLRTRTLVVVGLTMTVLYVLLFGGAYLTLHTRYGEVEKRESMAVAKRLAEAMSSEVIDLDNMVAADAARDSTYEFVNTRDASLMREETSDDTMARQRISFFIVLDEEGRAIYSRAADLDLEVGVTPPAGLVRSIERAQYLRVPGDPRGVVRGIMTLPSGVAIVSARSITTSDMYSAPRGTLVAGRFVDEFELEHLSYMTGLAVSSSRISLQVPGDAQSAASERTGHDSSLWWRADSASQMSAYAAMKDLQGAPALRLRAQSERIVNTSLGAALVGAAAALAIVCLAATMTVFLMIDWSVVGPLARLSRQVRRIGVEGVGSARVQSTGKGELGELADDINGMLDLLEVAENELRASRDELRESRDELEIRVEQRTRELWLSDLRHRELVERLADAVFSVDVDGYIVLVNERAAEMLGRDRSDLLGIRFVDLMTTGTVDPVERHLAKGTDSGDVWTIEAEFELANREPIPIELRASAYSDAHGEFSGTQWIARDITDRQRFERQLMHLATHDPLTGLANRRAFETTLELELAEALRGGQQGAVVWLDLDDFKDINDTLGHGAGDETLVMLSTVLTRNIRASNLLARVGGDEFAVLMPRITTEEAEAAAERILNAIISFTCAIGGRSVRVGASVGVVFFPEDGSTVQEVLSNADAAMYRAKEGGRSMVYVSSGERRSEQLHVSRMTWNERLNDALEHEGFIVCAQPILDLRTQEVVSHELLIRMRKQGGGVYPPSDFLPVAERLGLITEIDRWMLRRAIALLESESGLPSVEVNLSGKAFADTELVGLVAEELERSGVDPARLGFEITETAAIADMSRAQWLIRGLKDLGCRFSLDDFGTGFSSFYYLKHLPVDCLKIDGSYVRGLAQSEEDRCLVRGISEMCRGLGVEVLAECVEDEATLTTVQDLGLDYAQGYHIGRPVSLEEEMCG